jgi:hypothetical protein
MVYGCTVVFIIDGNRVFRVRSSLGADEFVRCYRNYQPSNSYPFSRAEGCLLALGWLLR